jgi:hypothetical protein
VGGGSYETEIDAWIASLIAQGDSVSSGNAAAWDAVVKGAKTAGYWSAMKCLVPIAGPALGGNRAPAHIIGISPTVNGTFAAGERTTDDGFIANGSAFLDTGILENSTTYFGGQDDWYWGTYITRPCADPLSPTGQNYAGGQQAFQGRNQIALSATQIRISTASGSGTISQSPTTFTGVLSALRTGATAATSRVGASTENVTTASGSPTSPQNLRIFRAFGVANILQAGAAIGAYWTGTSAADEAHFRDLLDTCFAALT